MTRISESHLLNIHDMTFRQVQSELQTTNWFFWQWLDNKAQVSAAGGAVEYAKFILTEHNEPAVFKLVLFGELNWHSLLAFWEELNETTLENCLARLLKPSQSLDGAVVIKFDQPLSDEQVKSLMLWAETQSLEFCVVKNGPELTRPGLLVMDMDSTAIEIECIDEIAKLAGVGEQVAEVTAAAMRGELDFAESLRARVNTLAGAPVSIIDQVADNLPLMPGLTALVEELQKHGWKLVIASGGFTYMTEALKRQLNLDETVANELEMDGDKLTGKVSGKIIDAEAKAETVFRLTQEYGLVPNQTIAMGDGANDLKMMAAANLGVAFHAKPLVREQADVSVRRGGLDQLLYLL